MREARGGKNVLLSLAAGALLMACAAKERLYGNIYEGVELQNRQARPTAVDAQETPPSYDEYLRQRRQLTGNP